MTDEADSGWTDDGTSIDLSIFTLDMETTKPGYRYRAGDGVWYDASQEADEFRLLSVDPDDASWQILSVFGDITEVCVLSEIIKAEPKALCVTSKNTRFGSSARTFISRCSAILIPK